MKNKITVSKSNNQIHFYLIAGGHKMYMFSQTFTKGVYAFFAGGRSESEIKGFKGWNTNPRLDKTITKLPMYIRYTMKECA